LYAKVITVLVQNKLLSAKKIKNQFFHKNWLCGVLVKGFCNLTFFIIFVNFLDVFSARGGVGKRGKMGVYPLVRVGISNRDKYLSLFPSPFSPG
jgi:hypothetical protein